MQCHALQCIVIYVCIPNTYIYIYIYMYIDIYIYIYDNIHTLHYIALHYIALHYIHTMHESMIHQMIGMASHHATCSTGAPRAQ